MKINLKQTTSSLLVLLLGWLTTASLSAATLTVTSATDGAAGSLRNRIASSTAGDVILFDASLAGQTLALTNEIVVLRNLTITATNLTGGVTIQGNGSARLFYIDFGASVTMSGINFTGGGGGGATDNGRGGAFNVYGTLALSGCKIYGNNANAAFSGYGGAMTVAANGTLTASQCSIMNNSATYDGAFVAAGAFTLTDCLISSNSAVATSGLGGNYAVGGGGGNIKLVNCTVTANKATTGYGFLNNGVFTMVNCTYVSNSAAGSAAMIYNFGTAINLTNCIVTANTPGNVDNVSGTLSSVSNLIGGSVFLGPLANNGGTTLTMALASNSPAINAGIAIAGLNTDQRGRTRQAFGASDIGAYERTAFDTGQTIVTAPDGASWYLGVPVQGSDLSIYREVSGQLPVNVGGAAVRIGQANDGTVLVGNLGGGIYSRTGSTSGVGSAWPQLTSVAAGDGATWFLGPDSSFGSLSIYRWANSGLPAFSNGAGTNLTVLFDGSIMTRANNNGDYRRLGSATGLGTVWQQVYLASTRPVLKNPAKLGNGNLQFGFTNQAGLTFSIYASTNLSQPLAQWTLLGNPVESPAGTFQFTDTQATNIGSKFYRVTSP